MNTYNKENVQNRVNLSYKYSYFKDGLYSNHRLEKEIISTLKHIDLKELDKIENILDLGCGQGKWMNFFNIVFYGKANIYGLDLSKYQIDELQTKFPNYHVECCSMTSLPYKDEKFNLITAFTSFMFLKTKNEIEKTFYESSRVLKVGGYLLVEDVYKSDGHFSGRNLKDNGISGFNISELDDYAQNSGFEKVAFKRVFKRLFWSTKSRLNTVNLSSNIGYTLTYLLELFVPGEMNNFIVLYKKVK